MIINVSPWTNICLANIKVIISRCGYLWRCKCEDAKKQVWSGAEARCRQEFGLRVKRGHPWSSLEPLSRPGVESQNKMREDSFVRGLCSKKTSFCCMIIMFQAKRLFFKQDNYAPSKIIVFQADNCVSSKQALCLQGDDTWRVVGRISTNKWPARAEKNLANPFCKRLSHFPEISYNTGGSYKLKKNQCSCISRT